MKSYAVSSHGWHCRRSAVVSTFGGEAPVVPDRADRWRHPPGTEPASPSVASTSVESRRFRRRACTRSEHYSSYTSPLLASISVLFGIYQVLCIIPTETRNMNIALSFLISQQLLRRIIFLRPLFVALRSFIESFCDSSVYHVRTVRGCK